MYRVFRTQWYAKTKKDLGKSDISRIDAFETQLKENPYHGRLLGTTFFREKKFDGKRMLFLIYENKKAVFLITVSEKKAQQQHIDFMRNNLERFRAIVEELLKNS